MSSKKAKKSSRCGVLFLAKCIKRLSKESIDNVDIYIHDDDLLNWYVMIHGSKDSPFEGGSFLSRISFSEKYPQVAPNIYFYTPNGRFNYVGDPTATNGYDHDGRICLTNTAYHPEEWSQILKPWHIISQLITEFETTDRDKWVGIYHINYGSHSDKMINDIKKKYSKTSHEYNMKDRFISNILKTFTHVYEGKRV